MFAEIGVMKLRVKTRSTRRSELREQLQLQVHGLHACMHACVAMRWGDLGGNGQPPPTVSVPPWQLVTTTLSCCPEPVERCGVKFHIFNRIVLLRQIGGT